jgi:Acetyltransferase (GNAT) family
MGIARALLTACLFEATDRVALRVTLDKAPARRLYGVLGF